MANLIEIFTKVHYAYIFIELLPRQQQQNIYTKLLSLFASIGFWTHNVEMWSEVLWKLQQHPHAHTHTHRHKCICAPLMSVWLALQIK